MAKKQSKDQHKAQASSAAQYLTFVAATGDSSDSVEMRYEEENIWLTQKMMAELYGVTIPAVNQHIKKLIDDGEIDDSVIKQYLTTAADGKNYKTKHYNLQAIISVGFKVENDRAVQFRKWARQIIKDYTIQGWTMDDARLKQAYRFDKQFFERQLQKIREIRASERMFYQKVTDIYMTSVDYDRTANVTRDFFKRMQNKLHHAVHRHTAAEIIAERADASKENMGLSTWSAAPEGKIQKYDVTIAKNYLTKDEMEFLERLVTMYLDYAELQATRNIPMTMEDWAERLDSFIEFNGREVLTGAGKISHEQAKLHAETQFEKYRIVQDKLFESDFDRFIELEQKVEDDKGGGNE